MTEEVDRNRDQSIWERLESLSKDDLIVELVYWRNMYGTVRVEDDDEHCPWPCVQPLSREDKLGFRLSGEITSDAWAKKIVRYALSKDPDLDPVSLTDYGLDEDQALESYMKVYQGGSSNPGTETGGRRSCPGNAVQT